MGTVSIEKIIAELEMKISGVENVDQMLKRIETQQKKTAASMGNLNAGFKAVQGLVLSVGLAFLFTGMALQRFFQTVLTSLFQVFLQAEGEAGILNNMLGELLAELAFVAFSFIDAFANSEFAQQWIDRIEKLTGFLTDLDDSTKA